jgi:agmatinase
VSYGPGTAAGPAAILRASQQLELYDEELEREPYLDYGIAALQPPVIAKPLEAALDQLAGIVGSIVEADRFPLVLGGEHSLTAGAIRPFAAKYPDLVVLQLDAHADLRDGYLGERFSHAAAMRRVLDQPNVRLTSVGIRVFSKEEASFYASNRDRVCIYWGKDQADWNLSQIVDHLRGRPIYVTFDVDALDSAVMPATGTPVPGGISYLQALAVLREAANSGRIVGGDVVELAPIPAMHHCDYTAASIAYKLMSYALSGTEAR